MNLLFVTEKFPYPLDTGGNVRTYHLLRGLASECAVTLVTSDCGDVDARDVNHVASFCRRVILAKTKAPPAWHDAAMLARSLFNRDPVVVARRHRASVADILRQQFLERQGTDGFDVVYLNHLDAAVYLPLVPPGLRVVLDEHNVVTNQVRSMAATEENFLRRWVLRRDIARLASYEARIADQMDLCLACSEPDAGALRVLGVRTRIAVVPNGVDTAYFRPDPGPASPASPTAVFVGTLDYEPCERGVWHFCTEILPRLRRGSPGFRFVVVGRNPSARLRNLAAEDTGIILTGRVDDVRPHLKAAQVCVVPLLSGSGTRLKILEAMAAGTPVVSTAIGAEGIDVVSGHDIWIADDPAEFAARVLQLMADAEQARRMREAARILVEEKYSWEKARKSLLEEMAALQEYRGSPH